MLLFLKNYEKIINNFGLYTCGTPLEKYINPLDIDYLIVSHTEPDHSGLIGYLINLNPEISIVASKVAIKFLEDQIHKPFRSTIVKSGDELDLGTNSSSGITHKFEFLSTPPK